MSGAASAAALRRSGSNSLSALLRAEEDEDPPTPPAPGPATASAPQPTKRRGSGGRGGARGRGSMRRNYLRLPLGGAGGCRVCACDEADPAPPRRRAPGDAGDDEPELPELAGEECALQCFSWKKGPAAAVAVAVMNRRGRATGADDSAAVVAAEELSATTLSALPDDLLEMVLGRLPLSSLLAARCACRRWRDLTLAPQLLRLRREGGPCAATTPWLFLFRVEGDAGWGAGGGGGNTAVVHALDVDAQRWRQVGAAALRGRSLFSVAGVGDELYVVGGRSGASNAGSVKAKTHKGVVVYSPLTGAWRKAAPMRAARSRPVLGVFEMSGSRSVVHARAEKYVRRANAGGGKFRLGGTSAVYEDPHRLSLRRLRLRDVLSEDLDSTGLAHGHSKVGKREEKPAQARQALIVVGGRGPWDEPLVSGEIYDPLTDKWVEIAGFPTDVGLACSGAVCGDTFYVYCESDTLVAYHLDNGSWYVVQTSLPPPRLRDYSPALVCCASRLFMLCVSWCDPASRRDKVVRKVFELVDLAPSSSSSSLPKWAEASSHPDAPMDPNAAFAAGQDRIYAVEMFRIFGKVLDFATSCRVSGAAEQSWSRVSRKNAAAEAEAMSCRLKSMAVLHL